MMNKNWLNTPLGQVLTERRETPSFESIDVGDIRIISKIGFSSGKIEFRNDTKTKTGMILIHPGDLVVSGINAVKGAIAIYPESEQKPIAATIHYGSYLPSRELVDTKYLWWFLRSATFREVVQYHIPGGIKTELKSKRLLSVPVHLPPIDEQHLIVARIDILEERIIKARKLRMDVEIDLKSMLLSTFSKISDNVQYRPMAEVAPLLRRPVKIEVTEDYHELGIRSFGRGTFHKPPLSGGEVGTKRLFEIKPGDLVFNNVFAWEGAVAVAKPEDEGRVGSHRFITCVPKAGTVMAKYLWFYFLTEQGLEKLGGASPGGAGRNRTLGIEALGRIEVPVPDIDKQLWFDNLLSKVDEVRSEQAKVQLELDALLPSILDKAFKGEL